MSPTITRIVVGALAFVAAATTLAAESDGDAQACRQRVQVVTGLQGCVAFWDFVKREPDGQQRFTAHVPPGATNDFPLDAGNYNPPEDKPLSVQVLSEAGDERTELREYRYTKVQLTLRKGADGSFSEISRDLVALRLNPWWYPHDLYTPPNDGSGGPFTIGRVIHSSRSGVWQSRLGVHGVLLQFVFVHFHAQTGAHRDLDRSVDFQV